MEKDSTNSPTFFKFEDLRVYDKSLVYVDWIYNTFSMLPDSYNRELYLKFVSSSQAISFYIAEGSARNKSQFVYYLKLAKSAIRECVVLTTIAEKQTIFGESSVTESRELLMELTKMLGALIGSLQRSGINSGNHRDGNKGNGRGSANEIAIEDPTNFNRY